MASAVSIDVDVAIAVREELEADLAGEFGRRESRAHARDYVRALCSELSRKNCWRIAEEAGDARPDGKQRLLYQDVWDEWAVRDRVRAFAARHLADADAGLIFDESGQEKSGTMTAGVGRQYTGTAGKITNAIVVVYTNYASRHGHCLIDADLYAQKGWFTDPDRFAQAGFDADHTFRTKPEIAVEQAERALDSGLPVGWRAADEVYGRASQFRRLFEKRKISYVVAVGVDFASLPVLEHTGRMSSSARSHRKPGTAEAVAREPKVPVSTTGPWSPPSARITSCSSAGRSPHPTTWPTSTPSCPTGSHSPCREWSTERDTGGWWRKTSTSRRARSASTTARSVVIGHGFATPFWLSRPTRSTRSPPRNDASDTPIRSCSPTVTTSHPTTTASSPSPCQKYTVFSRSATKSGYCPPRSHNDALTSTCDGRPGDADTKPEPAGSITESDC